MKATNFNKGNLEELKEKFEQAKVDENFNLLVSKLDLDDEVLMKYTTSLQDTVVELMHCKTCQNLGECKNKVRGYVYYPSINNNHLRFNYMACKHEKRKLQEDEFSCDYYEMPDNLKHASMRNIELDDAKRVRTIKWLKNFYDTYLNNKKQKGLYLHGSFGSGKTFLVCSMLNELSKRGVDITIVYYPELLRKLKEAFSTNEFGAKVSKLKNTSILFIDDIGAESVTEWSRDEILGTILQHRMESNLPTFFTSNLTIDELETHLSNTKSSVEKVKARRIIERIKQLSDTIELVSKNRRN